MVDLTEAKRALLADYERERDELDAIISRLRRELGVHSGEPSEIAENTLPAATAAVSELIKPGDLFGMTQVQATVEFLKRGAKQPRTLQDIAAALHRGKVVDSPIDGSALRNLSSILSRSPELISIARGRWGLVEWYPNSAIKKAKKSIADKTLGILESGPSSLAKAFQKAEAETEQVDK